MAKYTAVVRFEVLEFEADSTEQADFVVDSLINDLGSVDTKVAWDNVDWIIEEAE